MRFGAAISLAVLALWASSARADPDFGVTSDAWNGASRFVAIARRDVPEVLVPGRVDLARLGRHDALIVLGPSRPLPDDDLVALVRGGGRLVVADDFGTAGALLARFGMRRSLPASSSAPRVRGDDALLVARAFYAHPLTEGVPVLVTNRPLLLEHPRLVPLFALEQGGAGVVLTGVVGSGRVVAIGDPSVFTNAMMELDGNRRFAANVVRFATAGDPPLRLVIAAGDVPITGTFSGESSLPLRERVENRLRTVAEARMPEDALRVAGIVLAMLFAILLSTMRDTRKEAAAPWLEIGQRTPGRADEAALALRDGIDLALRRRLGIAAGASGATRKRALAALGLGARDITRLLSILDRRGAAAEPRLDEMEETLRLLESALARNGRPSSGVEESR